MQRFKELYVDKLVVSEMATSPNTVTSAVAIGTFSSTSYGEGKGVKLSASNTSAFRIYTDDGGAVPAASNLRTAIFRFLNTKDTTAEVTQSGSMSQLKIYRASGAVDLGVSARYSGAWGYVEMDVSSASSATVTGAVVAGLRSTVEIDKAFTVAAGAVLAGLAIEAKYAGAITATGRSAAIYVETTSTYGFDALFAFSSATLCGVTVDTAATGANRTHKIKCVDAVGTPFYLNGYVS